MSKEIKSKGLSDKNSVNPALLSKIETKDYNYLVGTREFAEIMGISFDLAKRLLPTIPYSFKLIGIGNKGKLLKIKYGDLVKYIDSQLCNNQIDYFEKKGGIKPSKRVGKSVEA